MTSNPADARTELETAAAEAIYEFDKPPGLPPFDRIENQATWNGEAKAALDAFLAHPDALREVMGLEQVGWRDGPYLYQLDTPRHWIGKNFAPVFAFRSQIKEPDNG